MHSLSSSSKSRFTRNNNTGRDLSCQYFILFALLLCSACLYGIYRIKGFAYYPDEFGYWANAARYIGYDWSEVASLGSYYSFGYGLILAPILAIFKGGIAAYRAAIVVNLILQCSCIWMIGGILRRLYPTEEMLDIIYATGIAMLYPVWTFYVQITLCEALVTFMYTLVCYLMVRLLTEPRWYWGLGLILSIVYICFVHMRTLAVPIAAVMVSIFWAWKTPKLRKYILIGLGLVVIGAVLGVVIKSGVVNSVFGHADADLIAGNTFAGQIATVKRLLTVEGILAFIQGCIAKIYYLGATSYGLFYIGSFCYGKGIYNLIKGLRDNEEIHWEDMFRSFLLLSLIGQFLITAMYMNLASRLDEIFYGRYNDYLIPMIIGTGVIELKRLKHLRDYTVGVIVGSAGLMWIGSRFAIRTGSLNMHRYFVAGISYLWGIIDFNPNRDFWSSYIFSMEIVVFLVLCIWGCKGRRRHNIFLIFILAMEIVLGILLNTKNTYVSSKIDGKDMRVVYYIEDHGTGEEPVQYLANGDRSFIDLIQFGLKDRQIDVIYSNEELSPGYLITDIDDGRRSTYDENYPLKMETPWFALYKTY